MACLGLWGAGCTDLAGTQRLTFGHFFEPSAVIDRIWAVVDGDVDGLFGGRSSARITKPAFV